MLTNSCPLLNDNVVGCFYTMINFRVLYIYLARGLNLYQVLAPNAYSYVKAYVSTINKDVKSKVYKKVIVERKWRKSTFRISGITSSTLIFAYRRGGEDLEPCPAAILCSNNWRRHHLPRLHKVYISCWLPLPPIHTVPALSMAQKVVKITI